MKNHNIIALALLLCVSCANPKQTDSHVAGTQGNPMEVAEEESYSKTAFDTIIDAKESLGISEMASGFSLDLFKEMCAASPEGNICLSPSSIVTTLAMILNGAQGETRAEITNALGLDSVPLEQINKWQHKLLADMPQDSLKGIESSNNGTTIVGSNAYLSKANLIAFRKGTKPSPYFLDIVNDLYRAKSDSLTPGASTRINQWCLEQTKGMINGIVNEDSIENSPMLLANAIYFNGYWEKAFSDSWTGKETFYTSKGKVKVMMMNQGEVETPNCHPTDEAKHPLPFRTFTMNFIGGRFAMLFALPNDKISTDSVLTHVTAPRLFRWAEAKAKKIEIKAPKLKIENQFYAEETLKALGINRAFSNSGDLSGIAPNLFIGQMVQKAVLEMNEDGTRCAAETVTFLSICENEGKPILEKFHLDHPFLFFILDKENKEILFEGRVTNPAE